MQIYKNAPASRWGEALPIGNGHIGGMVYGGVHTDIISLSEETFFSGNKSEDNNQPGAQQAFYQMRRETAAADYAAALHTAERFIGIRNNYGSNLPVGQLQLTFRYEMEKVMEYKRSLDLRSGLVQVGFRVGQQEVDRQIFVSSVHKCLIYKTTVSTGNFKAALQFISPRTADRIDVWDDGMEFYCQARENLHSDGTNGITLYGGVQVQTDGAIRWGKRELLIEDASELCIYLQMVTDFEAAGMRKNELLSKLREGQQKLLQVPFEQIRTNHIADIRAKMDRVQLWIDSADTGYDFPLMFQYGRYLLLCSSREDSRLPAHLQGVWNDNVACQIGWSCDMHLDINTQMNYWPAEVCNLPEVNDVLFRWIKETLVPEGQKNARVNYGLDGWAAELVANQYGYAAPYWAAPLSPCPTGGVWILTHMWEHFLFTEDLDYLKQEAFPIIEEAVIFFTGYVFEDPQSDYLIGGPSISPENSFMIGGCRYWMSTGCTYEMLMIRQLYDIYLAACEAIAYQPELYKVVKDQLTRLLPYGIAEDGTLKEWNHEYQAADPQHRHTSHLLGIYPFHQITAEDKELAAAAIKVIEGKLRPLQNWEDTGWARALLVLYEARLRRPDQAYRHLKSMYDTLRDANDMIIHPPTRGADAFDNVYELDGNTGLTAAVAEMLLQSHNGIIRILPGLPGEWKSGSISGLKARGGVEVSITWMETLIRVTLVSERTSDCTVMAGNNIRIIHLEKGKQKSIDFYDNV